MKSKVFDANPAFETIIRYDKEELIDKNVLEVRYENNLCIIGADS